MTGWSIETLKEYFDKRFENSDESVKAALSAAKEAVTKAETAAEKRFESVNEFRNTLSDQQRNLMPRSEAEVKFESYTKQLDILTTRLDKSEGRGLGIAQALGWIIAGITIIGFIITKL
jgi:hypothetical protein